MEGTRIAVLFRVWGGPHAPQSAPKTPSEADLFAYAAAASGGQRNNSSFIFSDGFIQPRVWRGRSLSSAAMRSSSSCE